MSTPAPPKSILVVDDTKQIADGLVRLLELLGWNATGVYSAAQAHAHLTENTADLILLDISMPEMDGYEFCAVLRNELHLTIPIVALSGYGLAEDRQKAIDHGCTDYIIKPVGMEQLHSTITALL